VVSGFQPGFPYLGGLPEQLAMPRRANRACWFPPGPSVLAAQTGIYPLATPGGWQLLGRTPLALFDPKRKEPVLLRSATECVCAAKGGRMLKIIRAGMYTSVQDGGREGLRQLGISRCGAMDKPALVTANLLVGNGANAAALEITLGQVDIQFERSGWFALTGAACEAKLDGEPVWVGWRTAVKAGQHLVLKNPQHGAQLSGGGGGIAVPKVLGSRSTDLKVGIGGLEGSTFAGRRPAEAGEIG
jgi:hypothetical protein